MCGKTHFKDTEEFGTKERNRRMPLTLLVSAKPQRWQAHLMGSWKSAPQYVLCSSNMEVPLCQRPHLGLLCKVEWTEFGTVQWVIEESLCISLRLFLSCTVSKSSLQSHHKAPFFYPPSTVMLFTIVLRVDSLPHLELSQTHYKLISSSSKWS